MPSVGAVLERLTARGVASCDLPYHDDFRDAVLAEFSALDPSDAEAIERFFTGLKLPQAFLVSGNPYRSSAAWIHVLDLLRAADAEKYALVHKGTPYYFLAIANYLMENFDRAVFFLDAAVAEDAVGNPTSWPSMPAGLFLGLDETSSAQFARPVVSNAVTELDLDAGCVSSEGGHLLTADVLRGRLVRVAINQDPSLRSVVTALITFLMEHRSRVAELELAPRRGPGSGEACFLHLFKGALVFESLLRHSGPGRASGARTLGQLLGHASIAGPLGLPSSLQSFGRGDLAEVAAWGISPEALKLDFGPRAIRVTWGVRNTTGHALTWSELDIATYRNLYLYVLGAVVEGIFALY